MTDLGSKGAFLGLGAGFFGADSGHRVARVVTTLSRFVHFTAGVALPLAAAAPGGRPAGPRARLGPGGGWFVTGDLQLLRGPPSRGPSELGSRGRATRSSGSVRGEGTPRMRALRIILIVTVILGGLFVIADRVAVGFAEGCGPDQEHRGPGEHAGRVHRGLPTEVVGGELDDVKIGIKDYEASTSGAGSAAAPAPSVSTT